MIKHTWVNLPFSLDDVLLADVFGSNCKINALFEAAANLVHSPETSFNSDSLQASPKKRLKMDHASHVPQEVSIVDGVDAGNEDPDESIVDHGLEHVSKLTNDPSKPGKSIEASFT